MCLALQNYHSAVGMLPPAYRSPTPSYQPGWAWGTLILPFVEQEPLYKEMGLPTANFGVLPPALTPIPIAAGPNTVRNQLSQTKLPIYRCPSDTGPDLNPLRMNHAMSNYRAIMGPNGADINPRYGFAVANQDLGGLMFQNSTVRMETISDGTSNTLAIGECMWDGRPLGTAGDVQKRAAIWVGMTGLRPAPGATANSLWISDVMWWMDHTAATVNGTASQAFSSWHPGGVFFGFGDGSVRFYRNGGNPDVLRWLAGRNDGRITNHDF
jgi:hypothetical protein